MKLYKLIFIFIVGIVINLSANTAPTQEDFELAKEQSVEGFQKSKSLADYYSSIGQVDSAKTYRYNSLAISKQLENDTLNLIAYYMLGIFYGNTHPDSTIFYSKKIIQRTEKATHKRRLLLRTKVLSDLGYFMLQEGEGVEGLNYYFKSRDLAEKEGFYQDFLLSTWNICNVYSSQKKYKEAFSLIDESISAVEDHKEELQENIHGLMRIKAWYYGKESNDLQERNEGLKTLFEAYHFYEEVKIYQKQAFVFLDMSNFFSDLIEPEEFLKLSEINLKQTEGLFYGWRKTAVLAAHGKALLKNGMYAEAIKVLEESQSRFKEDNFFTYYLDATESLLIAYNHLGRKDLVLEKFNEYQLYQDSMVVKNYEGKLLDLEKKYETEKQEQRNQELKQANELAESKLNLFGIIGLFLFTLFGLGSYFYYKMSVSENKLKRINASKNRLFAILAHDLKGPAMSFNKLTSNVSYLIRKNDPERLLQVAEHFEFAGEQVNRILTNLLDWAISQKDEFELNPQAIDVKKEIQIIMEDLKYATYPKRITIKTQFPDSHQCQFDKNSFSIIVRNLLHNAIKYSFEGSEITVELLESAGKKNLIVKDQGVGISPELMQKINNGQIIESMMGTQGELGNALGLSTCYSLAKMNKSSLFAKSRKGGGSEFVLSLN